MTVRNIHCPQCGAEPGKMCRWHNGKTKSACRGRYVVLDARQREIDADARDG